MSSLAQGGRASCELYLLICGVSIEESTLEQELHKLTGRIQSWTPYGNTEAVRVVIALPCVSVAVFKAFYIHDFFQDW
jgi:hypothetical protein